MQVMGLTLIRRVQDSIPGKIKQNKPLLFQQIFKTMGYKFARSLF